jgi:hypothetical protein
MAKRPQKTASSLVSITSTEGEWDDNGAMKNGTTGEANKTLKAKRGKRGNIPASENNQPLR